VTEQKAWELLSIIDQIHMWGVTDFREFVIRHLKPWHEFCKKCYVFDVCSMEVCPEDGITSAHQKLQPTLPAWARHFSHDAQAKLRTRADELIWKYVLEYSTGTRDTEAIYHHIMGCLEEGCAPFPGYPISSPEEAVAHHIQFHGGTANDGFREIAEIFFAEEREPTRVKRRASYANYDRDDSSASKKTRLE
jgi:hypothetical protein